MDPQSLDGYFTNLVYEMEWSRNRMACGTDREDACDRPQPSRTHGLPWLTAFAVVWLSAVTVGLWL